MNTADKSAWRTRLRAQRRELPSPSAGAALARVGLDWLGTLDGSGAAFDGGTAPGALDAPAVGAGGQHAICAYISRGSEPPTLPLLEALNTAGFAVYVPVCEPNFQMSWTRWHPGAEMVRSFLAPVMEPVGPRLPYEQLGSVQAIFVPALAVDGSGVRLGQGGGYYDRFLAGTASTRIPPGSEVPGVPLAAVVHEHEVFPAGQLPHDSLDAPVLFALTPTRIHRLDGA